MSLYQPDETAIRRAVAPRTEELGAPAGEDEIKVRIMPGEAAPGCRVFRASWGGGPAEHWLSGLVMEGHPPDTYPGRALARLLALWRSADGGLRDPRHAATVAAYLLDPGDRHQLILDDEDAAAQVARDDERALAGPPETIAAPGETGISFWWTGRTGLSRMRIRPDGDEAIRTEEAFARDLLGSGTEI